MHVLFTLQQYNQCVETAQAGEREVERLTRTLGDTRSEYRTLQIKNTELVKAHNELSQKLRRKVGNKPHDSCIHILIGCRRAGVRWTGSEGRRQSTAIAVI